MEHDNKKLNDEIAYMKEQFSKIDKETPLPASLSGAYLLQKMKEQEVTMQPEKKRDNVIFWSKRILPLAACFAVVLGIFLGYNKFTASLDEVVFQQEALPENASPIMTSSDDMNEDIEEAVEESAEDTEEADGASYMLMKNDGGSNDMQDVQETKISSFFSYEQIEEQLNHSPAVMSERRIPEAAVRSDAPKTEKSGALQNAIMASISDGTRQISVVQGEENLELYILGNEKDAVPAAEIIPAISEVHDLYLKNDILTVIGDKKTGNEFQTQAIQYEISENNIPQEIGSYSQSGKNEVSYYDDDILYLVSSYPAVGEDGKVNLPEYSKFGEKKAVKVEPSTIFYKEDMPSGTFTIVSAIANTNGNYEYNVEACLGKVELMIDDMTLYNAVPGEVPQFLVDVYETEISFE